MHISVIICTDRIVKTIQLFFFNARTFQLAAITVSLSVMTQQKTQTTESLLEPLCCPLA